MKTFRRYLTEHAANADEIDEFLGRYWTGDGRVPPYRLTADGLIDVDVFIEITQRNDIDRLKGKYAKLDKLDKLPDGIQFNEAKAGFSIINNRLTTLKGCPRIISKGGFYCGKNNLTSLEYAPEIIIGTANFSGNPITSLHNIHKHIKEIHGVIKFAEPALPHSKIRSHVLGLLKIVGPTRVSLNWGWENETLKAVDKIINRYLPNTRGNDAVLECQNELIDAGYEEYAQL